jgi:hypothetical protein
VLAAYRAEPAAGVHALLLEHIAVSLNPRQGLAAGERLSGLLAVTGQHHDVLSAFAASLDRMQWRVYEVRRVLRPRAGDPARAANASRSLRAVAAGSRAQMTAVLRTMAKAERARVEDQDGIERAWLRRRGAALPAAEHFLVAAPAGPQDKGGPGFEAAWQAVTASAAGTPPEPTTGQLMLVARSLKMPMLAAFTTLTENRTIRAVLWVRCRSTWVRCRTDGRFLAMIAVCGQAEAGNGADGSAGRGHGQQPAAGEHVDSLH